MVPPRLHWWGGRRRRTVVAGAAPEPAGAPEARTVQLLLPVGAWPSTPVTPPAPPLKAPCLPLGSSSGSPGGSVGMGLCPLRGRTLCQDRNTLGFPSGTDHTGSLGAKWPGIQGRSHLIRSHKLCSDFGQWTCFHLVRLSVFQNSDTLFEILDLWLSLKKGRGGSGHVECPFLDPAAAAPKGWV